MLKWVLIAIAVVVIGGCTAVVGGIYWAVSSVHATPDFYKDLAPVELTEEQRAINLKEVEQLAFRVVPSAAERNLPPAGLTENADEPGTADASTSRSSGDVSGEPQAAVANADSPADATVATEPLTIALSEPTLNAYATSLFDEYMGTKSPFSDPRIRLGDGYVRIGVRLTTPDFSGIASLDVEPKVRDEKSVELLLQRIALGNLAIPLERAMSSAQINTSELPEGIEIPQNSSPPRVILSWDHLEDVATTIEYASVTADGLVIQLFAPTAEAPEEDTAAPAEVEPAGVQ